MESAEGELIVLQVGAHALSNLVLPLLVVLDAEGALEESRDEQVPALVLLAPGLHDLGLWLHSTQHPCRLCILHHAKHLFRAR